MGKVIFIVIAIGYYDMLYHIFKRSHEVVKDMRSSWGILVFGILTLVELFFGIVLIALPIILWRVASELFW